MGLVFSAFSGGGLAVCREIFATSRFVLYVICAMSDFTLLIGIRDITVGSR